MSKPDHMTEDQGQAELYALERDILCDHLIDYIDCGDCRIPQHIIEAANE